MRAAAVVLTVMVVLGAYIWGVDILWLEVFKRIGFLEITKQVK